MKKRRFILGFSLVAGIIVSLAAVAPSPQPLRFTFEETAEGWANVPPPTGTEMTLTLTDDPAQVKVGKRALRAHYRIEPRKLPGLVRSVDGLVGTGVRVWLKTDTAAMVVLGLVERDGSSYMHAVRTLPGEWLHMEARFAAFGLSDDSKDENGRLDLEQVGTLVIADAGGFLPGADGERTLCIDEYEVTGDIKAPDPKPYLPLLQTGRRSASGARATAGVTYRPGKFGRGMLTDAPGELVAVPVEGTKQSRDSRGAGEWHWEHGTVEMWLCPQFDAAQVRDFTALLAMQDEPFITGFRGSLLVFYTQSRQIAFLLNADLGNILATPPLTWKAGEWHHLAASWGAQGMRLYVDGKPVAQNRFTGGPGLPVADVVVGNQAWTIASHRFANTVVDELRLSRRQRTDEAIAAAAKATSPLASDEDTAALEHFDGEPLPPITLALSDVPFHAAPIGKSVRLTALVPGSPTAGTRLSYTVSTPSGAAVRSGAIELKQQANAFVLTLKPFQASGFYRITFRVEKDDSERQKTKDERRKTEDRVINEGSDWFRITHHSPLTTHHSPLFGASGCFADPHAHEEFFRRAGAVGVRSLRMPFEWEEIEPKDNQFVWDKYDRIVEWADKYGVELIPTFIWEKPQPEWAGRGKAQRVGLDEDRYPPEDLVKWSDFVFQVVNRYKGRVRWWIPANEPNLSKYWHPKPDAKAYVALLKATREAARRADPQAKILGCNVAGMDLRFLEECFKEGALSYCDAIGAHPYICPHSPDERIPINILDPRSPVGTFHEGLLSARALIKKHGGQQKLWLDEVGQPYRDDFVAPDWGVSEEKAAEYLVKIYAESLASGAVERALWFSFWGGDYGSFALLKPDGNPTLPLVAYAACSERLGGATFVGEGVHDKGIRALVFRRGGDEIVVLWCPQGAVGNGRRAVPLRADEQAFDLYGFPLEEANRAQRLSLNRTPRFVVGARKGLKP